MVVVIDALRADFVLDPKNMGRPKISWLAENLEMGVGRAWVARASPPTVTLPRFNSSKQTSYHIIWYDRIIYYTIYITYLTHGKSKCNPAQFSFMSLYAHTFYSKCHPVFIQSILSFILPMAGSKLSQLDAFPALLMWWEIFRGIWNSYYEWLQMIHGTWSTLTSGQKHCKWGTGRWLHCRKMAIKQQVNLHCWL